MTTIRTTSAGRASSLSPPPRDPQGGPPCHRPARSSTVPRVEADQRRCSQMGGESMLSRVRPGLGAQSPRGRRESDGCHHTRDTGPIGFGNRRENLAFLDFERPTRLSTLLATVALVGCTDTTTQPPVRDTYQPAGIDELGCVPDYDGQITRAELGVAFDVPVTYRVAASEEPVEVDLHGIDEPGGPFWDWSADLDDERIELAAAPLAAQWFGASFPDAGFVSPMDVDGHNLGVYSLTDDALLLHGFASASEEPVTAQTLVRYATAVPLYRFPFEPGDEWVAVAEVSNARLMGLPYAGRDTYTIRVDAAGAVQLPEIRFPQAHRVRMDVVAEPAAGAAISRKQVSWVTECFGEVVRATSQDNEPADDFQRAAEVRRLGL